MSFAVTVAAFATVFAVTVGVRGPRGRAIGHGLIGLAAALLVFVLQSVSVGASLGGAILALSVGGMTLLVLTLVRST